MARGQVALTPLSRSLQGIGLTGDVRFEVLHQVLGEDELHGGSLETLHGLLES